MISFLLGVSIIINFSDAYVLLQVRKQDGNTSNVDALIHTVVPSGNFEKIAEKIARKQFSNKNTLQKNSGSENEVRLEKKTEISMSMDENTDPDLVKLVDLAIKHFTKPKGQVFRANNHNIKPKTVKFRSGESSVLYEINSQSLISAIEELLSSKIVMSYLDNLTRKAAFVYRSMQESKH